VYEGQGVKKGETRSLLTQQKEQGAKKGTRYIKKSFSYFSILNV
jgi:hypothetical protein